MYFQIVQNLFISETQTHFIDNGGSANPDLEKINRDLLRQLQKLQAQPVNTVKAAVVANADQVQPITTVNTFQPYNKTCPCGTIILVDVAYKAKHASAWNVTK